MDIKLFTPENYKKTKWSGGTTTELFIYPEQATFKNGDYDFRLSIASVEIEESIFTKLQGVKRTLMVLEGQIKLSHQDHHESELKKFGSDKFFGNWTTKCVGTCTDFNLMTKAETSGSLTPIVKKETFEIRLNSECKFQCFYLHEGNISIISEDQRFKLGPKHLLVIDSPVETNLVFESNNTCELIQIDIK